MKMIFCSRVSACKSPYGAVKTGKTIEINIYPHRHLGVTSAELLIGIDGGETEKIPFVWKRLRLDRDVYTLRFKINDKGLYWYRMRLKTAKGVQYINRTVGSNGVLSDKMEQPFQLTVTDRNYSVPDWFGKGITYNIFPDRFHRVEIPNKSGWRSQRKIHDCWEECPDYLPDPKGEILNNDFFGGSFKGIQAKLDYLSELNIKTIYLNPIFEAYSNHRYDTGDYKTPDPMLGTEEDFKELCEEARKRQMNIILDGVFSHTGFDSKYFNGRGSYNSVGAYQSKQSEFYDWYNFSEWPNKYASWWGIYTLPETNEMNRKFIDYVITSEESVIKHWLRLGVAGWRLDVADELPDDFIKTLNYAVKSVRKDGFVIGEVWEDASNKVSYSKTRQYFHGNELDSVMNYPLRDAILKFLDGDKAENFKETIETLRENYPQEVFNSLMNIIGTHDTPRILTVLGSDSEIWKQSRDTRAHSVLSEEQYDTAKKRLFLASVIQFTFPGSPCIYYGDEAGMQGYEDPFNRRTYPWGKENTEILSHYKKLCKLKSSEDALSLGNFRFIVAQEGILVYERRYLRDRILVVINREDTSVHLPYMEEQYIIAGEGYLPEEDGVRIAGKSYLIFKYTK